VYSFTDGFSGYHQIRIAPEDRHKTPSLQVRSFSIQLCHGYIVPSPIISTFIEMDDPAMLKERLERIIELEEDRFIAGFQ